MFPIFISAINDSDDRNFVEMLYVEHKDKIYRTAYKILNDENEAEDVVSETFIRIINNLSTYRHKPQNELTSIIFTIAKHIAIDKYRKIIKIPFLPLGEIDGEDLSFEIEDFVIEKDLYEKLYSAIDKLPMEYMQVVKLKLLNNFSNKEISNALNISESNVRTRYLRAKKMLSEYLQKEVEFADKK